MRLNTRYNNPYQSIMEGSLEVKLPTDGKAEVGRVREDQRREEKTEDQRKKIRERRPEKKDKRKKIRERRSETEDQRKKIRERR
jgi:hypothetical protein